MYKSINFKNRVSSEYSPLNLRIVTLSYGHVRDIVVGSFSGTRFAEIFGEVQSNTSIPIREIVYKHICIIIREGTQN